MQNIVMYIAGNETLAPVKDYANARNLSTAATFVYDVQQTLKIRIFADSQGTTPYPLAQLTSVAAWCFALDSDWDGGTAPKVFVDSGITVSSVEDTIAGNVVTFTEFSIPIEDMASAALEEALGTNEEITLNGELTGFDGNGNRVFVQQIKKFVVRNLLYGGSSPTPPPPSVISATTAELFTQSFVDNLAENATVTLIPQTYGSGRSYSVDFGTNVVTLDCSAYTGTVSIQATGFSLISAEAKTYSVTGAIQILITQSGETLTSLSIQDD